MKTKGTNAAAWFYRQSFNARVLVNPPARVHFDPNEGKHLDVGCLACRQDVRATLAVAMPARLYIAAFVCDACGCQLFTFDILNERLQESNNQ